MIKQGVNFKTMLSLLNQLIEMRYKNKQEAKKRKQF